jgi:5-methyltetrahydropteroyltriglutamate--homocysteine methyltransferase
MSTKLPSRADHVGSFLRPQSVIEARDRIAWGDIDAAALRAIEDEAIAELVTWQESLGLKAITDGEFRRYFFHTDFLLQLAGVEEHGGIAKAFKNDTGKDVHFAPPKMVVSGKIEHVKPIQLADYQYLASLTAQTRRHSGRCLSHDGRILCRRGRRLSRGSGQSCCCRMPVYPDGRYQPCLSV